jgi:UDP-3-O-[3-hydroxymyristoyl] glucosamine N-acyltransferase
VKLQELANSLGCELRGDGETEIVSAAPIESAAEGQISFVANAQYLKFLETTSASALILANDEKFDRLPSLRDKNPYLLYARAISLLYPDTTPDWGVAVNATVSPNSKIHSNVFVGEYCVVEEGASIGAGSVIDAHCYIGKNVHLGDNCRLYPNVVIREDCTLGNDVILQSGVVIGGDGFGYARSEIGYTRIKQIGTVVLGDRVEIGANCAVDRGALGPTVIGDGVKIDNLVQIAHNVQIGENSVIVSQVGISGSTKLGKWVTLAGQAGLIGHLDIGDRVVVTAQSGVTKDIPADTVVFGSPAREIRSAHKIAAAASRLPELSKRVKALEETLAKAIESNKTAKSD